jgi:hypothetical protein
MPLRKQEDTGSWRRKLRIALFGEISLEEAMDMSQDKTTTWLDLVAYGLVDDSAAPQKRGRFSDPQEFVSLLL